jgi:hypothetical protein
MIKPDIANIISFNKYQTSTKICLSLYENKLKKERENAIKIWALILHLVMFFENFTKTGIISECVPTAFIPTKELSQSR